jgi:hypothetical protein
MKIISWFRLQLKRSFDRIRNENLKKDALQAIPFWIASVITGLATVLYTKLFVLAENFTSLIFNQHAWILLFFRQYVLYWHGG